MNQKDLAQLLASALNIAAQLLPMLEDIKAVEGDLDQLRAKYDALNEARRAILTDLSTGG
jgi:hypothetical protein